MNNAQVRPVLMIYTKHMTDGTANDLRRASLRWLERFFILLFVTLAVWYLIGWWALVPGALGALVLVRSSNTYRVAGKLDEPR